MSLLIQVHLETDDEAPPLLKIKYYYQNQIHLTVLHEVWDSTLVGTIPPLWLINNQGGVSGDYTLFENPLDIPIFYHGINSFSALTYFPATRKLHGVLDQKVYVENLPLDDVNDPEEVKRYIHPISNEHSSNTRHRRGANRKRKLSEGSRSSSPKKLKENNEEKKKTLYPEIFLIVDVPSEYFGPDHPGDYEKVVYYVLSYLNCVDMLFRTLKRTNIRLNIAGILMGKKEELGRSGLVDPAHIRSYGQQTFIASKPALHRLGQYFYQARIVKRDSWDFLIWMTSTTLIHGDIRYLRNSYLHDIRTDFTEVSAPAACGGMHHDEDRLKQVSNRAIVMYDHKYSHYDTAARGLAHLMFVPNDDVVVSHGRHHSNCLPSNPGIQSSGIMDPTNNRVGDYLFWSFCSEIHFEEYSRSEFSCCLFNYPYRTVDAGEPPYLVSIESQCECYGLRAHHAQEYQRDICPTPLMCANKNGKNIAVAMPLDGTPCFSTDPEEEGDSYCVDRTCI